MFRKRFKKSMLKKTFEEKSGIFELAPPLVEKAHNTERVGNSDRGMEKT